MARGTAALAALAVVSMAAGCGSYSKRCYDGVCEVTKNGKTTYEGDPEKIAAIKAKKKAQADKSVALKQKYAAAPRRGADEPIQVGLVMPVAGNEELARHAAGFYEMLVAEFGTQAKIEVVPFDKIKRVVAMAAQDEKAAGASRLGRRRDKGPGLPTQATEPVVTKLRNLAAEFDVVVFTRLLPKKKTGLVRGGGGAGVAQVELVELSGSVSSIYDFEEHTFNQVGKSTSSLALAGRDKKGKFAKGSLDVKRKIEKDRPAVQAYVAAIVQAIEEKIRPRLPALAQAREIRAAHKKEIGGDAAGALRKLFGKQ